MNLENKRIFVTGGSSGIGKSILAELKLLGANLVFCALEVDLLDAMVKELKVPGIQVDLSKEEGVQKAFDFAIEKLGGIDVLINNAGGAIARPVEELSRRDFEYMYALNAIAPIELVKMSLPHFKSQGFGDVVNIGGTASQYGFKTGVAYGGSKAALSNMSKCLVSELREYDIRVFHVDPSRCDDDSRVAHSGKKLTSSDVAKTIVSILKLERNAFVPEMSIWATNPF